MSQEPSAAQLQMLHQQQHDAMLQLQAAPHELSQSMPQDSAQQITESGLGPQTDGHMGVLQQDLTHQLTEAGSGPHTDGQTEVLHQDLTQQLTDSGSGPRDLSQQLTDSGSGPQTLQVGLCCFAAVCIHHMMVAMQSVMLHVQLWPAVVICNMIIYTYRYVGTMHNVSMVAMVNKAVKSCRMSPKP